MRWPLIILSLIFSSYGYSQPVTLSILGRTSYTTYPTTYIYKINNAEHVHTAADFDSLKFILDSLGVIFRLDSTIDASSSSKTPPTIDFYTYSTPHAELV